MKKHFRLLSIFLVLILSFSLFSVNAFAVEDTENLVDDNMSNWVDFGDESPYFQSADVTFLGDSVNYIEIPSNSTTVLLFDLTQFLKIGDSYRFAFNLPTTNGYNSSSLTSCVLTWALCDGSGDDYPTVGNSVFEINIDDTNKSKYLGKTTVFEFTYTQGFQNTFLCLFVSHGDNVEVYEDLELYISNISLERVTSESEKKLDGILGWLQDIWDKLVSIGDGLTEVWTNITSSVSSLGDRISSFFSELGSKISTEFTNLTSDFSGYISSLGDRFSGFITSLGDRISGFFENLSVNINGFFTDMLDGIKEFFKGFGNLILYFNWEGEFENPFVYEHSLIGDFVGSGSDGEDDEVEEEKPTGLYYEYDFSTLDLSNYTSSGSSKLYAELFSNNVLYLRGPLSSIKYGAIDNIFRIPVTEFEILKTYTFEFTVSDFNYTTSSYSSYNYFELNLPDGSNIKIYITDNGVYKTSFTLSSCSRDFFIYSFRVALSYSYCLSDLKVYEVVENGSSGDTGSDEEGTTEKKSVSQFFDDLVEYLSGVSDDIETVIDSITGPVVLLDEFTKRFEWLFGIVSFVLMMIVASRFIGL